MQKKLLQYRQRVKRIDDEEMGTIIQHSKTFGKGDNQYESYLVEWDDGHIGVSSDLHFTVEKGK